MENFIFVIFLLSVNLTCHGIEYGVDNFWNAVKNGFFSQSDGQESAADFKSNSINQYWLYTRDNPLNGKQIIMNDSKSVLSSNMKSSKDTVFIIHGWFGKYEDIFNVNVTAALLINNDVNVICVDWSKDSRALYSAALKSVRKVGTDMGDFIIWLVSLGYSYEMIHLVGHSLGAHVAGYAGRQTNGKIKRITGLDPAGPGWDTNEMVSSNNAQFVECIHTNAKLLGTDKLCGHADFFPNGGILMPGCGINMGCGHFRAFYYFSVTVVFPDKFVGYKCSSVEYAMDCACSGGSPALMGNNDLDKKVSGIYCLETKEDYPYYL